MTCSAIILYLSYFHFSPKEMGSQMFEPGNKRFNDLHIQCNCIETGIIVSISNM